MHNVICVTEIARDTPRRIGDGRRRPLHRRHDDSAGTERTVRLLRAALARAERPVRARALARELGLPSAEVTVQLRRLQDSGVAESHDRRWRVVDPVASGEEPSENMSAE